MSKNPIPPRILEKLSPRTLEELKASGRLDNLVRHYTSDQVTLTENERGARKLARQMQEKRCRKRRGPA